MRRNQVNMGDIILSNKEIFEIAMSFRLAIITAKQNREFNRHDRMSGFPSGCCDDASDLLAYYLINKYNIYTEQGNGVYRDNDENNTTNHAWLIVNRDMVIDITGDQFEDVHGIRKAVYVGKEDEFYKRLDNKVVYANYDISQDERLWNDYQIIQKYIRKL